MKTITYLGVLLAFSIYPTFVFGQENNTDEVFLIVEQLPEFPGGRDSLVSFLINNLKYPEQDRADGKEGKVYLSFIVEKDGRVTEVTPIGKVDQMATPAMVAEAMRIVNIMPTYVPGKQRGKAVRCKYTLPIVFRLQ